MRPEEFRERFVGALPNLPAGVKVNLAEFVEFDEEVLEEFDLSERDKRFLALAGLPKSAAPFLSFYAWGKKDLANIGGIPADAKVFALGQNGSGDVIVIDLQCGEVVYFNHDRDMERVFVNSSLLKFAESLCVFAEYSRSGRMEDCMRAIEIVDEQVRERGGFWVEEVRNVIAGGG